MKITVLRDEQAFTEADIDFMNPNASDDDIIKNIKALWTAIVADRDSIDGVTRYKIRPVLDNTAHDAVILSFNVTKFLEMMTYLVNAYIPRLEGAKVLQIFYNTHAVSMPKMLKAYETTGKYPSITQSECGIFAFSFYSGTDWAKHDMDVISNVGLYTTYDVCDYSVITDAVRQCPVGSRPMVWLNPIICAGFKEASESSANYAAINTLIASVIIVSALETTKDDIEDDMATQLWDVVRNFLDNDAPFEMIKEIFTSAERLLFSR